MDGKRRLTSLVALSLALLGAPGALACGPFFQQSVLVHQAHPDLPLSQFGGGNTGIVRPGFARSYLAVAYRYFDGKPLNAQERRAAEDMWLYRLGSEWVNESQAVAQWKAARKEVLGDAPCEPDQWRSVDTPDDSYQTYLNCPDDAFRTAAATLEDRQQHFGKGSASVKDWLKAQDEVFCNCGGGQYNSKTGKMEMQVHMPAHADASADPLLKADRAYQIASAKFYAGQYEDARKDFEQIAADKNSPWHVWAPYLVTRTMVREATLAQKTNTELLEQARSKIEALLGDSSLSVTHVPARQLLSLVQAKLSPEATLHALSKSISDPGASKDFRNDLKDYTVIYDNVIGRTYDDIGSLTYAELPAAVKSDDLSNWIAVFQSDDEPARQAAFEQYARTKSPAWLIAALSKAKPGEPGTEALLQAALAVKPESPAYLSTIYYAERLLKQTRPHEAKTLLDRALALKNIPPSSANLLLDDRTAYVAGLREFVNLSLRTPAVLSSDYEGNELPDDSKDLRSMTGFYSGEKVLSPAGAQFFNLKATLPQFVEAVQSNLLPPSVFKNFVQAVWTRAFLLGDAASMNKMSPLLSRAYPQLKASLISRAGADAAARRFDAVFLLLHNPGMRPIVNWGLQRQTPISRIDDFQDNWWSSNPKEWPQAASDSGVVLPTALIKPNTDREKIAKLGSAATFLAKETVKYARLRPQDARLPEALALAVKATRFGPKDDETTRYSKEAFQILHTRFPASPWTKRTPYWY